MKNRPELPRKIYKAVYSFSDSCQFFLRSSVSLSVINTYAITVIEQSLPSMLSFLNHIIEYHRDERTQR